jgi:hypothetical protein
MPTPFLRPQRLWSLAIGVAAVSIGLPRVTAMNAVGRVMRDGLTVSPSSVAHAATLHAPALGAITSGGLRPAPAAAAIPTPPALAAPPPSALRVLLDDVRPPAESPEHDLSLLDEELAEWRRSLWTDPRGEHAAGGPLRLRDGRVSLQAGQVKGQLSGYTLSTALQGIHAQRAGRNALGAWGGTGVLGVTGQPAFDAWDAMDTWSASRSIGGGRLFQSLGSFGTIGANLVEIEDDAAADSGRLDHRLMSLDLAVQPFGPLWVTTEVAGSTIHRDGPEDRAAFDTAANVQTDLDLFGVHLDTDYERVGDGFRTGAHATVTDREQFQQRLTWSFQQAVKLGGGWRRSRDNLRGQRAATTITQVYDALASGHPLPLTLPQLLVDVAMSLRERAATDASVVDTTRTISTRVTHTTGPVTYGGGYSTAVVDDAAAAVVRDRRLWDLFLRASHQWRQLRLSPTVTYGVEHDWPDPTLASDAAQHLRLGSTLELGALSGRLFWSMGEAGTGLAALDQTHAQFDAEMRWRPFGRSDRMVEFAYHQQRDTRADVAPSAVEHVLNLGFRQEF